MKTQMLFKGPINFAFTEKIIWNNYHDPIFSKTTKYKTKQYITILNSESKSYQYIEDESNNRFLPIIENNKLTLYINYKLIVKFNIYKLENILFELKLIKNNLM